jgi:hypothetical protein
VLEKVRDGTDARLDDPELLGSKKDLLEKMSPLAVVNQIKQKHASDLEITIEETQIKQQGPRRQKLISWQTTISIVDYPGGFAVETIEQNKQKSK